MKYPTFNIETKNNQQGKLYERQYGRLKENQYEGELESQSENMAEMLEAMGLPSLLLTFEHRLELMCELIIEFINKEGIKTAMIDNLNESRSQTLSLQTQDLMETNLNMKPKSQFILHLQIKSRSRFQRKLPSLIQQNTVDFHNKFLNNF